MKKEVSCGKKFRAFGWAMRINILNRLSLLPLAFAVCATVCACLYYLKGFDRRAFHGFIACAVLCVLCVLVKAYNIASFSTDVVSALGKEGGKAVATTIAYGIQKEYTYAETMDAFRGCIRDVENHIRVGFKRAIEGVYQGESYTYGYFKGLTDYGSRSMTFAEVGGAYYGESESPQNTPLPSPTVRFSSLESGALGTVGGHSIASLDSSI